MCRALHAGFGAGLRLAGPLGGRPSLTAASDASTATPAGVGLPLLFAIAVVPCPVATAAAGAVPAAAAPTAEAVPTTASATANAVANPAAAWPAGSAGLPQVRLWAAPRPPRLGGILRSDVT